MLIAPLDIFDIVYYTAALCRQTRYHQRRTRSQVGSGHPRAREGIHTSDYGCIGLDHDIRAHLDELIGISEAIVKYTLYDHARAASQRQHRRELSLHIRRKARIGQSHDMRRSLVVPAYHAYRVVQLNQLAAYLVQLGRDGLHMLGDDIADHDVASGDGGGAHEGSRLYLIGDDRIVRTVEPFYSADPDDIGARTSDIGSHAVQEVCHIDHMRLLGYIFDDGLVCRQHRRQHDIDRRSY